MFRITCLQQNPRSMVDGIPGIHIARQSDRARHREKQIPRVFVWRGIPSRKDHKVVQGRIIAHLVEVAVALGNEGREGKPIGTIFVIGDPEELEPHLRQLVLNPCVGHPRKARSIYNPDYLDTLREYAAMDGAFIVSRKGVVEAAASYLASPKARVKLRSGLGARHASASSITAVTDSLAIVLSD